MPAENVLETDVLVIGGGIAGCFAAIKAREQGAQVILVDKAYTAKAGGTLVASAGYMFFNPELGHNLDASIHAISKNGEYLNNREWTEIIMNDSWATYQDLLSWGVDFPIEQDHKKDHYIPLTMTDPSGMRTLFGQVPLRRGNFRVLRKQAVKSGAKVLDRVMVTDLLKQNDRVTGAIGFSIEKNDFYLFKTKAIVISTGMSSFKPSGSAIAGLTGDGDAMAYRAGAELTGKEFSTKFVTLALNPSWRSYPGFVGYPCFTDVEGNPIELRNIENVGFWDLAMDNVIHEGKGPVIWNFEKATSDNIEMIRKMMMLSEGDDSTYTRQGLDLKPGDKIRIAGGAGIGMADSQTAGIWPIDTQCATSVEGLFAAGESCGTRYLGTVHTARGFGLTASAVTGTRAGTYAAKYALGVQAPEIPGGEIEKAKKDIFAPLERKGGFSPRWVTQLLHNTMVPYFVLHIKQEDRLRAALTMIEFFRDQLTPKLTAGDSHELRLAHETRNMVLNAEMMVRASLFRTESRGQHYREDYPGRNDPEWLAWVKVKEEKGKMAAIKVPMPEKWWPDLSLPYQERYPRRFINEKTTG
jgi:succinate dehydrogenase/fumarate reductase flavoprotein subunit